MILFDFLYAMVIFYLRVLPMFLFIPLFHGNWLTNSMIKNCIIVVLGIPFLPLILPNMTQVESRLVQSVITEVMLGVVLAFPVALPFWIANVAGQFLDNQRGATISSSIDPNSGVDASILAAWFNFYCCVIFVAGNGFIHICNLLRESYVISPPGQSLDLSLLNIVRLIGLLDLSIAKGIIIISPVIITLFLSDVLLAVLSRYAPQLNPFSLSLTIKSAIAFGVLILYFTPGFQDAIQRSINNISPLSQQLTLSNL